MYSAPYGMRHLSKTVLNIIHFYTNPNFYWLFENILPSWIRNKSNFWKIVLFGEVMWERNISPLRTQDIFTWRYGQMYVNMTSAKLARTRHHIRRFPRRSLVLKIKPNIGQTIGTTDKRERRKNIAMSEGPNSDCNIEIFLYCKDEKSDHVFRGLAYPPLL